MNRELAMIVPSRGRPGAIGPLVDAWRDTSCGHAHLIVAVDDDDPALPQYQDLPFWDDPADPAATSMLMVQGAPGTMVAALNRAARTMVQRYSAVGFMGDDHRPRTVGWDTEFLAALADRKFAIAYGDDLFQRERLPTHCVMTSHLIRVLGYMAPPGLQHLYVDDAWRTLGIAIQGLVYLPEVVVEHVHPAAGKGAMDEGYARVNHPAVYARDEAMFRRWVAMDLQPAVAKIRAAR